MKKQKKKTVAKPGVRPLSRMHPDHPRRKEFQGQPERPNLEAPKNQEFVA